MKQRLTIETEEAAVIQLLRSMARTHLIRLFPRPIPDNLLPACLNEPHETEDASLMLIDG